MKFEEWKRLMASPQSSDRSAAADILPEDGANDEIVALLLNCLDDAEALVRICAIDTLRDFPNEAVARKLRSRLLEEGDDLAKAYLLNSLGYIGGLENLGVIVRSLEEEQSIQRRIRGADGLLVGSADFALGVIKAYCEDNDWRIRTTAFSALNAVVTHLVSSLKNAKEFALSHRGTKHSAIASEGIEEILKSLEGIGPSSVAASGEADTNQ